MSHQLATFLVGLVVGLVVGWQAGVRWVPVVLGRIAALAYRDSIRNYRRRRR